MKLNTRQQKRFRERRPAQGSLEKDLETLFQRAWSAHHRLDRKSDRWQAGLDELKRLQRAAGLRRRARGEVNFATLWDIHAAVERFIESHDAPQKTTHAERRRAIAKARRKRQDEKMAVPQPLPSAKSINRQAQWPAARPDPELQNFYDQADRQPKPEKVKAA